MRALVTGGNGFTGSHLARHLVASGYEVRVLVRRSSRLEALEGLPVEYAHADLGAEDSLAAAVQGIDLLFHVAAVYRSESGSRRDFYRVNVGGTRRLLQAAKLAGVKRFVHCSTVGVQGDIKHPPATEEAPFDPGDHYQQSKLEGELLARDFFRHQGLAGTVVRPTGIYGPGDTRFLKLFRTIQDGTFRMIGDGQALYHLTFVEDLVAGIALAGERAEAEGEVFTIGGEEYLTLNALAARIAKLLGVPLRRTRIPVWPVWTAGLVCEILCKPFGISPPLYRRRVDFFVKDRAFDISKARTRLGYQPRVSLDEGLRRTVEWYRERGLLR